MRIAIANQKGGTAKTTLAYHLAIYFARCGLQVVMIDTDAQGSLSKLANVVDPDTHRSVTLDPVTGEPHDGIFDILFGVREVDEVLIDLTPHYVAQHSDVGTLHLLPGFHKTMLAGLYMQMESRDYTALGDALRPLVECVDVVIYDTSPTLTPLSPSVFEATDFVLIPTLIEELCLDGVRQLILHIADTARYHSIGGFGIVPVMTPGHRTLEYREQIAYLTRLYGDKVWPEETTHSTIWIEASSVKRPIMDYMPKHKGTAQLAAIVNHLAAEVQLHV